MENSPALYHTVWDILMAHVGAREDDRERFVQACLEKDKFGFLRESSAYLLSQEVGCKHWETSYCQTQGTSGLDESDQS